MDIGCGAGASAIPAAEVVGKDGKVVGIDLAEKTSGIWKEKSRKNES